MALPRIFSGQGQQSSPSSDGLIGELDEALLQRLDEALARQETRQTERLLNEQERRGLLRSGETGRRQIEEVLGPGLERRQQALLPLAKESALLGREERLGETGFQRQRQFQSEAFMNRLTELQKQSEIQEQLMRLEASLRPKRRSFFGQIGDSFAGSFGSTLGGGLATGSLFGAGSLAGNPNIFFGPRPPQREAQF